MSAHSDLALDYCNDLFASLVAALSMTDRVLIEVERVRNHAPTFPESRFCKACVLPVVDRVTTSFLSRRLGASPSAINAALACEGFASLASIYTPAFDQSGFGRTTIGRNYQPTSKMGKAHGAPGYLPCPDFGVGFREPAGHLAVLGEVKFSSGSRTASAAVQAVRRDLLYCRAVPNEPNKGWDYDFGFGIAYAGGGPGLRDAELLLDDWPTRGFVIARFEARVEN